MSLKNSAIAAAAMLAVMSASTAHAAVVQWTQWDPATSTGVSGAIGVTYTGEDFGIALGYPSWGPNGTFNGGTVSNAPPAAGGIVQLTGGDPNVNTLTFSSAVLNPVMAIWSLGNGGAPAEFVFSTSNISVEAGGPSAEYGGQPLLLSGNTVLGGESNGTIQFNGLVQSISWTNPDYEYWYGFTVGTPGVAGGGVPEPGVWALMLAGFGGAGAALRRRRALATV